MKTLTAVAIGVLAFSGSALAAESKEAALGLLGVGGPVVNRGGSKMASIQSTAPAAAAVASTAPAGPASKAPVAGGATTTTSGSGNPKPWDGNNGTALNVAPLGEKEKKSSGTGLESVVIVGVSLEDARVGR